MAESREGGCQCGKVRYRLSGAPVALAVCHCRECQRQSGSAFGMSLVVRKSDFDLLSGELRDFVRKADSGGSVRCAFCPECGTRIYHDPTFSEDTLNVRAGTLDDTSSLEPNLQVWTSRKQAWLDLPSVGVAFEQQPPTRAREP